MVLGGLENEISATFFNKGLIFTHKLEKNMTGNLLGSANGLNLL
jgi:hypothetical protein